MKLYEKELIEIGFRYSATYDNKVNKDALILSLPDLTRYGGTNGEIYLFRERFSNGIELRDLLREIYAEYKNEFEELEVERKAGLFW